MDNNTNLNFDLVWETAKQLIKKINNLEKYTLTGEDIFINRQNEYYKQLYVCYNWFYSHYDEDYASAVIMSLNQ